MDIPEGDVVLRARFDPDLRRYWYWQGAILLACSFIGIPLLPFWFLGLGRWYGEQAYGNLEAVLTRKALHIRQGVFLRRESTLPLERVQDLSWHQGPLMRRFGLEGLRVETAGMSGSGAVSEAGLLGVAEGRAFRDRVLALRDAAGGEAAILGEIRDSLGRIEKLLGGR